MSFCGKIITYWYRGLNFNCIFHRFLVKILNFLQEKNIFDDKKQKISVT